MNEAAAPGAPAVALAAEGVSVVIGGRAILDEVSLELRHGEVLALVGPNGAGKSTLLGVLSGEQAPSSGRVVLDGRPLARIPHLERARLRSVLTQENALGFPFTVGEVVEMGRSPWRRRPEQDDDDQAIANAVAATDIGHLVGRRFPSLSGGEKARASLARVLAQHTDVVLLDEPTAALDLRHQEDVMRVARGLAASGRAVGVVLHDLSLAGAYAHRVALLSAGRIAAYGTPREVLSEALVGRVYGLEVRVVEHEGAPLVVPVRG